MEQAEAYHTEAETIFTKWLFRTLAVLEKERQRLKVEDTQDLKDSIRGKVMQEASGVLGGQIFFLTRGRFVDMGAGRKRSVSDFSSTDRRGKLTKTRKPKRWYSPAFYGRLNDLQGALGIQLMESCVDAVKNEIF